MADARRLRRMMFLTVCGAALAGASSAAATPPQGRGTATAASTDSSAVSEVVVTARRVTERLQDVPLAVSAVSGQALERQTVTELKELTSSVPNLSIYQGNASAGSVVVSIRGQVQSNNNLLNIDPAVGVYVDGFAVPRNAGLRSGLVDIARVEVLRGPQGTLYGRNTTGGAVSIITNDPAGAFGGSLRAGYGNYNASSVAGVLNVPLGENLGLRLVGVHEQHDPYGHQVGTGVGLADEDSTYVRAKLKYDAGPLKVTLSGDYFRFLSNGPIFHLVGLTPASADPRFSGRVDNVPGAAPVTPTNATGTGTFLVPGGQAAAYVQRTLGLPFTPGGLLQASSILQSYVFGAGGGLRFWDSFENSGIRFGGPTPPNTSNSKGGSVALDASYQLSDTITLRSISGWRTYTHEDRIDYDSTPFNLAGAELDSPWADFYSQEFQILGDLPRLTWVLGGYYSYERGLDLQQTAAFQPVGSNAYSEAYGVNRNTSRAIFGQGSYKLTDDLTLTVGARYTWDTKDATIANGTRVNTGGGLPQPLSCNIPVTLRADPAVCRAELNSDFSNPTWLASLDYKLTPEILAYVKTARGYRAGGQQTRAQNAAQVGAFAPFQPETLTEVEAGLKTELLDRQLTLNVAAYYDKYQDIQKQVTTLAPGGAGQFSLVSNAASARLYGVEGEFAYRPNRIITVNGTLGYLNAKYDEFRDVLLGDRSGEAWPAPKLTYSLGASADVPTGFGLVSANVNWDYRSKLNLQTQAINRDQVTQKGFGLLNARLALRFDSAKLEVAVFARNLLNKKYYDTGISSESLGINTLVVGEPRTYGVQVTKRFGAF